MCSIACSSLVQFCALGTVICLNSHINIHALFHCKDVNLKKCSSNDKDLYTPSDVLLLLLRINCGTHIVCRDRAPGCCSSGSMSTSINTNQGHTNLSSQQIPLQEFYMPVMQVTESDKSFYRSEKLKRKNGMPWKGETKVWAISI